MKDTLKVGSSVNAIIEGYTVIVTRTTKTNYAWSIESNDYSDNESGYASLSEAKTGAVNYINSIEE